MSIFCPCISIHSIVNIIEYKEKVSLALCFIFLNAEEQM